MQVEKFEFESNNILVLTVDGEPWFKGKDVAAILEYKEERKAIEQHVDEDDKALFEALSKGDISPPLDKGSFDTIDIHPQTVFINESGLYSLILGSKLPKAKEFKRWVTSEVLPALRKTGEYKIEQNTITALVQQLILKDQQHLEERKHHLEERKQHLELLLCKEKKIKVMRPNAVLPAPSKAKENNLYILNKNESKATYHYYAVRAQTESARQQLRAALTKFPNATVIYRKENDPNAVRLYNVAKTKLCLAYSGNEFDTQLPEDMLIMNLDMLYNEYL